MIGVPIGAEGMLGRLARLTLRRSSRVFAVAPWTTPWTTNRTGSRTPTLWVENPLDRVRRSGPVHGEPERSWNAPWTTPGPKDQRLVRLSRPL